jgi:hypothetical protein
MSAYYSIKNNIEEEEVKGNAGYLDEALRARELSEYVKEKKSFQRKMS